MLTDPSVFVVCDYCGFEEEVPLSSSGIGGYDLCNVNYTLLSWGWEIDSGKDMHICPDCLKVGRGG